MGRFEEAKKLFQQTLTLMNQKLGYDHPDTITCLVNLAESLRYSGMREAAVPLYEDAIGLIRESRSGNHPHFADALQGLAICQWSDNQLDAAIPLFEEAVRLQESELGRDDFDTLSTLANVGVVYRDAGRLEDAISTMEEVAAKIPQFPELARVRGELRQAYLEAGRKDDVAKMLTVDQQDVRSQFKPGSAELAGELAFIGLHLVGIGDFDQAELVLRESCQIRKRRIPTDWRTFNTQSLLGEALVGKALQTTDPELAVATFKEAEQILNESFEKLNAVKESMSPISRDLRLGQAIDRLIELYITQDREDEVKKWQAAKQRLADGDHGDPRQRNSK
jgi:tetratricopeptide (TPR) repeat protein